MERKWSKEELRKIDLEFRLWNSLKFLYEISLPSYSFFVSIKELKKLKKT